MKYLDTEEKDMGGHRQRSELCCHSQGMPGTREVRKDLTLESWEGMGGETLMTP